MEKNPRQKREDIPYLFQYGGGGVVLGGEKN